MTLLGLLLAIFKAIPALKESFDQLIAAYIQLQLSTMREQNRKAIKYAIDKQDQRALEEALGNPNPGEKSNVQDSEVRDSLPGVS